MSIDITFAAVSVIINCNIHLFSLLFLLLFLRWRKNGGNEKGIECMFIRNRNISFRFIIRYASNKGLYIVLPHLNLIRTSSLYFLNLSFTLSSFFLHIDHHFSLLTLSSPLPSPPSFWSLFLLLSHGFASSIFLFFLLFTLTLAFLCFSIFSLIPHPHFSCTFLFWIFTFAFHLLPLFFSSSS